MAQPLITDALIDPPWLIPFAHATKQISLFTAALAIFNLTCRLGEISAILSSYVGISLPFSIFCDFLCQALITEKQ